MGERQKPTDDFLAGGDERLDLLSDVDRAAPRERSRTPVMKEPDEENIFGGVAAVLITLAVLVAVGLNVKTVMDQRLKEPMPPSGFDAPFNDGPVSSAAVGAGGAPQTGARGAEGIVAGETAVGGAPSETVAGGVADPKGLFAAGGSGYGPPSMNGSRLVMGERAMPGGPRAVILGGAGPQRTIIGGGGPDGPPPPPPGSP